MIDPFSRSLVEDFRLAPIVGTLVNWSSWALYWNFQGVILAGWWCLAHEAGHGTLSSYNWVNHFIGFTMHTVGTHFPSKELTITLTAYFSSLSHHTSHGDRPTVLTTRRRCPLNVTKPLYLEHAPITDSPVNLQPHSLTTMIFLRKRRSILSSIWSLCKLLAGNIIFSEMSWALLCILLERMWVA